MVIAIYLLIVLASVTQSATSKLFHRHCPHAPLFNVLKAGTALVL